MSQEITSGFVIPVDKQSLFILVFEDILLKSYNIITVFEEANEDNLCEIKFNYFGSDLSKFPYDTKMAKNFLKQNMYILHKKAIDKKQKKHSSKVPEVIDLEDESSRSVVDLTDTEPELIILDDTVNQLNKTLSNLNASLSELEIVDLCNIPLVSKKRSSRCDNEVSILEVVKNNKQLKHNSNNNEVKIKNSNVNVHKRKHRKRDRKDSLTVNLNKSGMRSVQKIRKRSCSSSKSIEAPKKKKRKLKDVSNFSYPISNSPVNPLTGNVLKYYSKLTSDVQNIKKREAAHKQNTVSNKHTLAQHHQELERRRRLLIAQTQRINNINSKQLKRRSQKEANIFNPNPLDVDVEGFRPVVVDGSNVARGHGKGSFSVKGIEICVDYFNRLGNKNIKVFLPLHCEEQFTKNQLSELKSKCDVIFTPSQIINGVRMTPYDDRFIVQYAVEFGGVIVSTDHYRDLLKENPRWRDTINRRLLMFTWVDDFLMFPMDPLGKNGPTLEEFLRF